jgi:monooxygenase
MSTPYILNTDTLLDVLIVGAGLSGIGTAYWLQKHHPKKQYTILEAREAIGGTWDLFRYPGVRSDSDMHTLGYRFKPWANPRPLADGPAIRQYIEETARENGIIERIQFGQKVINASWSSEDAYWTVEAEHVPTGRRHSIRTRFLYMCSGYYNYNAAHRPQFAGEEAFRGQIVLPQFWPKDLDYAGKRVVVVGSGATAVTIVPAMTDRAAHVTMLQRSPTYITALPREDVVAKFLQRVLPSRVAYRLTRWKNLGLGMLFFQATRSFPNFIKRNIMKMAAQELGPGIDVNTHFNPRYNPWDQRLCIIPDGDLFRALRDGHASVVTDEIAQFTPDGLQLKSGQHLPADIVVLATGLEIQLMGGAQTLIDGVRPDTSQLLTYKGMMMGNVPNFAIAFGYTNASWTLKTDLTANYVCRLLRYMDERGYDVATPRPVAEVEPRPFLDFSAGYVQRALGILPKQGAKSPWRVYQNYFMDMLTTRYSRVDDGVMEFQRRPVQTAVPSNSGA